MLALFLSLSLAHAAGAKASSELSDDDGKHTAALAFDGLLKLGWAEGADGYGEGSWLELDLGKNTDIERISIWPGNLKEGAKSYREYSRPRRIAVSIDGQPVGEPIVIVDQMQRLDVKVKPVVSGRKIRIDVVEVFEGIVFSDLYIAEVAVNFPGGDELAKLDGWLEGSEAKRKHEAYLEEVNTAFADHAEAEFGDEEAFAFLCEAAAEGPEYQKSMVNKLVPIGYRAQAIVGDPKAQEALRKLKDSNAIPALELASLRAVGEEERYIKETVEIFYAYQEMIGGGNRNVAYWGQSGWEPGALRGFGEPLQLDLDRQANTYVADTGNNRVQRFDDSGRMDRAWGPAADITDVWFEKGRPWYVSGSAPGEAPGQFMNPVDIETIPDWPVKEMDSFAVLDAKGRVQLFNGDGQQVISWTVQTDAVPEPKVGGQAYLVWVPKKNNLVVIMKDQAVVYTLDSEEVSRFEIEDGVPNAVEALPSGKLLLAYGGDIVRYEMDGFRHGVIIPKDTFGLGYEDIDMAIDELGKLWVFTDTGWVFKFKRPGKLEFKTKVTDRTLTRPRIAVLQGLLFFTSDDRIESIDVLQVQLDQAQAKEEGGAGLEEEW